MDFDISMAKPAPFLRRLGALIYDTLLLLGVLMLAVTLVVVPYGLVTGVASPAEDPLYLFFMRVYLLIVIGGFYVYFWTHGGQTLGMRAWRFRAIRDDGQNLGYIDALRRFGWAIPSLLPLGLGLFWALFDRDGRAWHDRRSGTRLVMLQRGQ
jgi:uncharacterized RDD family membrane protein YckC